MRGTLSTVSICLLWERFAVLHAGVVRYHISPVADVGLYEFLVSSGGESGWFLLDPDEAHALRGLIEDLDPDLEAFEFADVCGLVRAVTGAPPPEEELGWPPPLPG